MQKKVLAIHDISCVGRASLTVALPVISAAGIETSVLPTAVLSTQTSGFDNFTYRDLTADIIPIAEHWKSLGLRFDAIYIGYLGSLEQIELIDKVVSMFCDENTVVLLDPVMGDHGELYSTFTDKYPKSMASLCSKADILIPNMTEAALLLGESYVEEGYTKEYIENILYRITKLGPRQVILSGVSFNEGEIGAASYDSETGEYGYFFTEKIEGKYYGTGDITASVLLSAIVRGKTPAEAVEIAVSFVVECIRRTKAAGTEPRYGVEFETVLPKLIEALK